MQSLQLKLVLNLHFDCDGGVCWHQVCYCVCFSVFWSRTSSIAPCSPAAWRSSSSPTDLQEIFPTWSASSTSLLITSTRYQYEPITPVAVCVQLFVIEVCVCRWSRCWCGRSRVCFGRWWSTWTRLRSKSWRAWPGPETPPCGRAFVEPKTRSQPANRSRRHTIVYSRLWSQMNRKFKCVSTQCAGKKKSVFFCLPWRRRSFTLLCLCLCVCFRWCLLSIWNKTMTAPQVVFPRLPSTTGRTSAPAALSKVRSLIPPL